MGRGRKFESCRAHLKCLPLYQAIELLRQPALGHVGPGPIVPVVYLVTLGTIALTWALRRLRGRLET